MNKKISVLASMLAVVVLVGAGCASKPTAPTADHGAKPVAGEPPTETGHGTAPTGDHGSEGSHLARLAGSRVELENKNNLKPGDVTFRFKLYGLDGHAFGANDLKVAHEKKMHFLVVRDDMNQFQHIHPEYTNDTWEVKTTIPETGLYQLYIDVEPEEEKPLVLRVPVTIGGPTVTKKFSDT
ncbi:MAG: hypothetical protein EXS55_03730 [Candidatus Magasanikbacteria bacterium]|nr:hypothetical protein [Candidatus Magasanikbacteria bacterium]